VNLGFMNCAYNPSSSCRCLYCASVREVGGVPSVVLYTLALRPVPGDSFRGERSSRPSPRSLLVSARESHDTLGRNTYPNPSSFLPPSSFVSELESCILLRKPRSWCMALPSLLRRIVPALVNILPKSKSQWHMVFDASRPSRRLVTHFTSMAGL